MFRLLAKEDPESKTKEDTTLTDEQLQVLGEEVENDFFDELNKNDQTSNMADPFGVDDLDCCEDHLDEPEDEESEDDEENVMIL